MVFTKNRIGGFSQGTLMWMALFACVGLIVKAEFFPSLSKGMSVDEVVSKFGHPASKVVVPRPG